MSREKMPKITVQIEIEPDVLAYAIQGVAEQLELEILEMGLNPTQRDASRVAGLATAAKLLSKELSAWRDHGGAWHSETQDCRLEPTPRQLDISSD